MHVASATPEYAALQSLISSKAMLKYEMGWAGETPEKLKELFTGTRMVYCQLKSSKFRDVFTPTFELQS